MWYKSSGGGLPNHPQLRDYLPKWITSSSVGAVYGNRSSNIGFDALPGRALASSIGFNWVESALEEAVAEYND